MPLYDADYDEKKKLRLNETYRAVIKAPRNISFHKKYFALIGLAWGYQPEEVVTHFRGSMEGFREAVQVAAGHYKMTYSIARKEWLEVPQSTAFDKMDEAEFGELYERVKNVLMDVFLRHITIEEFEQNLANF